MYPRGSFFGSIPFDKMINLVIAKKVSFRPCFIYTVPLRDPTFSNALNALIEAELFELLFALFLLRGAGQED